jgi:hypothetical protein
MHACRACNSTQYECRYELLKKKSDALTVRFRALLKQIYLTKSSMGDEMKEASFALAEAVWAADSKFKYKLIDKPMDARIRVRVQNDNVAGVRLPVFEKMTDQSAAPPEACVPDFASNCIAFALSCGAFHGSARALARMCWRGWGHFYLDESHCCDCARWSEWWCWRRRHRLC